MFYRILNTKTFFGLWIMLVLPLGTAAQTITIEFKDNAEKPISKVQILNSTAKVIGMSDENGLVRLESKIISNQVLKFKKMGYEEQELSAFQPYNIVVLKNKSLSEVTISVSKNDDLKKSGTEVIDMCELGKLACCNLAESLENTNTIDVNYSDGITGGREIQMLALAGTYSSQTNEGIPYHRGILSKIGLELVPGPWIESIGISRGIGSVINGYDNISGTMNIEFMKPKKTLDWNINGYISEIAKTDFNLVKGFQLKENLHTNVLFHTSFSRMTMDNNHDGFTDMPVFLNINLMNKWQYLSENGFRFQAMVQGTTYESESGQILHNHSLDQPYIIRQKHRSFQAQFKTGWEIDHVKESSFAILYKFNYATQNGNLDSRKIDHYQTYGSISPIYFTNLSGENSKLKLGIQSLWNRESETIGLLNFEKTEFVNGGFAEWTGKSKGLIATLGLRGDYHNELGFFVSPRTTISFQPTDHHLLKFNAGFGFKTPTILTEAFGYLISNRQVQIPINLQAEKAFNGGLSYRLEHHWIGLESTIEAGYYLTLFQNQLILNLETPELLKIEYLKDNSRAQSFQIDHDTKLTSNWSLRLSYKNDQTIVAYDGIQKMLPLLKSDKFLANLSWISNQKKWRFSSTLLVNGQSRIPASNLNIERNSPWYPIVHGQINYVPNDRMDFYIGSENILNYSQFDRIQSYQDVSASSFDAGMIWGPMDVRRMYIGGKMRF